jgi:16S rRNA (guanine966-N2)-methyltransferase
MRITGGVFRGRVIRVPPGEIRPAMDRMREALFSMLGDITASSFLDLFSGSGIVALEAASRGAYPVHIVERDHGKKRTILQNIAGFEPAPVIHITPAERAVLKTKRAFDLIFVDPPFPYPHRADLLLRIAESRLCHESTQVIIHFPSEDPLPTTIGRLTEKRTRAFGRSILRFYIVHSEAQADTRPSDTPGESHHDTG